jgi:hypothetical protein
MQLKRISSFEFVQKTEAWVGPEDRIERSITGSNTTGLQRILLSESQ